MLRKIVVLAGPRSSLESPGVVRAAALARSTGAALGLLDVVYDPHLEAYLGNREIYAPLRERVVAERRQRLDALAAQLTGRGLRCDGKAWWAHPMPLAVVRETAAADVDLVVLEPDVAGALSPDEWRLISISPVPVLVARDAGVKPYASVVAAVDPERRHDKPVDLDERILDVAKRMSDVADARLEVVHCVPSFGSFIANGAGEAALAAEQTLKSQRKRELDELAAHAGVSNGAVDLLEGRPADVLAEKSASAAGSLVVLGTVQRGPIARFFIGSTAERVLRSAGGDVVVVNPSFPGDVEQRGDEGAARGVSEP